MRGAGDSRARLRADLTLGDFQSYLVFASIVFIYLNILWVGAVRPLLMLVINLWTPVKTHSNWCGHAPAQSAHAGTSGCGGAKAWHRRRSRQWFLAGC